MFCNCVFHFRPKITLTDLKTHFVNNLFLKTFYLSSAVEKKNHIQKKNKLKLLDEKLLIRQKKILKNYYIKKRLLTFLIHHKNK